MLGPKKFAPFSSFAISKGSAGRMATLAYPASFVHVRPKEVTISPRNDPLKFSSDTSSSTAAKSPLVSSRTVKETKCVPLIPVKSPRPAGKAPQRPEEKVQRNRPVALQHARTEIRKPKEKKDLRISVNDPEVVTTPKMKPADMPPLPYCLSARDYTKHCPFGEERQEPLQVRYCSFQW